MKHDYYRRDLIDPLASGISDFLHARRIDSPPAGGRRRCGVDQNHSGAAALVDVVGG